MLGGLLLAAALLVVAPAAAGAHSLIRVLGSEAVYLSQDATSLNTLTVRATGGDIEFLDPTVDGGTDVGTCRPGDITGEPNFWVIQAFCPSGGITRVRVDLGDREDTATITPGLPAIVLGGAGADVITTGDLVDSVDGGDGNDRLATGGGNDVVTAGLGTDDVDAGPGDDSVVVRDGLADSVRCGDGSDRVDADELDVVAGDCETVTRTKTAPPPDTVGIQADKTPPKVDASAVTLQKLGKRAVVRVAATSSERGTIGASGFLDAGDISLPLDNASARINVAGGGAELAIKLTGRALREAKKALKRKRRVTVRLSVVATDAAGNSAARNAPRIRLRA
ncbi:hypothetical protein OJ997_26800 [Solirubrobacter phytolaccae]|uniref:Alkaline phosphatase n=1 Tax=Solirubrobacter phytolaccae TaxID=1404360 RepID=A0A9X3NFB8_9ACTN|nr:hypothetical protein [Solirubrobacter phytolaccae]MDA0183945.1 hypothetical protein [Solirubrobacter phytolaccae]